MNFCELPGTVTVVGGAVVVVVLVLVVEELVVVEARVVVGPAVVVVVAGPLVPEVDVLGPVAAEQAPSSTATSISGPTARA